MGDTFTRIALLMSHIHFIFFLQTYYSSGAFFKIQKDKNHICCKYSVKSKINKSRIEQALYYRVVCRIKVPRIEKAPLGAKCL